MKKYNITYLKRFTAKNGKDYVSMELQSQTPSVSAEGDLLGNKTYAIIASAEKVPVSYMVNGVAECCLSFNKRTGKPFAYNFIVSTDIAKTEDTSKEPSEEYDDLPF